MKRILVAALGTVLAACGGSSGNSSSSNAAMGTTFTYGAPQSASADDTSAIDGQVSTVLGAQSSPSASSTLGLAEFQGVSGTLLGDAGSSLPGALVQAEPLILAAVARAGAPLHLAARDTTFENPTCATVSPTSVVLNGCSIDLSDAFSGSGYTGSATVNGSLTLNSTQGTADWNLTVAITIAGQGMSGSGSYVYGGQVAVTATTFKATLLADLGVSASGDGQSESIGVSESLTADLTYETSPTECATGGTIEAKRVWTELPPGATSAQYPNKGALLTFTGCGTATIASSP